MKGNLKNIIFDLGNVLFTVDYKKTAVAFEELGYTNFADMYSQFTADALFDKLEKGEISNEIFYSKMIASHPGGVTETQIQSAWNGMLLQWRENSLLFLEELAKTYKLYLLSNTNDIHLKEVLHLLKVQTGRDNIDDLFTKVYYSHKINFRKPNADIYEFVLKDANLKPEETLFIDDLEKNISAAASLGIKTHLLLEDETIENLDYKMF